MLMQIRHSIALLAAAGFWAGDAAALSFTPLGDLPGGDFNSTANGISADGNVVVGTGDGPLDTEAFRWTQAGGMQSLVDFPGGGDASLGYATDADGSRVVGQGSSTAGREAFRWDAPIGPMTGLGFLGGTPPESTAFGVSADGSVIVGRSTSASGAEAFRWTAAGVEGCGALQGCMITLGDFPNDPNPGATDSIATDVSDDGSVVVGAGLHEGPIGEAFRWTSGSGLDPLGHLPGGSNNSLALGVSGDGSTVVGSSDSTNGLLEAFVWTAADGMRPLGDLEGGAFESRAHDASEDGSLIVGYGTAGDGQRAVIWSSGALFDLNVIAASVAAGWVLEEAFGISANGLAIVGRGSHLVNNVSVDEAWLLRLDTAPIPEPGTGVLLALGLLALGALRHRR